jgi:hypothetical protein
MLIAVLLTIVSAWQYLSGFWETVRAARSKAAV